MANPTLTSKFVNMTGYNIFLAQVQGCVENVRNVNLGLSYIPPQIGGIFTQQQVLVSDVVLQTIDFKETT